MPVDGEMGRLGAAASLGRGEEGDVEALRGLPEKEKGERKER
jgi:hypothetical protein